MNISEKTYFNLPVDLLEYSYFNKYEKALAILLYFKSKSDGILNERTIDFSDLKKQTRISDRRTFKKYISILIELNWIGYNKKSGNYFIRSFSAIGKTNSFNNKLAVRVFNNDIKNIKSFTEATIISKSIRSQKYATEKSIIKLAGKAALKNGRAVQAFRQQKGYPPHYGLSNERIAQLLKISKSHGNRAKLNAEKNGYLKTNKKEKVITTLPLKDFYFKFSMSDNQKIRFKKLSNGFIKVYKQLHDEIITLIEFCRRRN